MNTICEWTGSATNRSAGQPGDPARFGDDIRLRRTRFLVTGISRDMDSWGRVEVDVYERRTSGLISDSSPGVYACVGEGFAYGVELEWRRITRQWETGLAYSWGRSK
jgi:hypothetical protein